MSTTATALGLAVLEAPPDPRLLAQQRAVMDEWMRHMLGAGYDERGW